MKNLEQVPRAEYPRPQFVRQDWLCLNGKWEFEIDAGDSGLERGLLARPLNNQILVPFCPEAPLSGVNNPDYMNAVWYRRSVIAPAEWAGKRLLLHFQAVDYDTTVWANGREVGRHRGGFTSFSFDLGQAAAQTIDLWFVLAIRTRGHNPEASKRATTLVPVHFMVALQASGKQSGSNRFQNNVLCAVHDLPPMSPTA